jgi:hypothetical protein
LNPYKNVLEIVKVILFVFKTLVCRTKNSSCVLLGINYGYRLLQPVLQELIAAL